LFFLFRVVLHVEDLRIHFQSLAESNSLPALDELLSTADTLIQKYVSLGGYERVLSIQNQRELKNQKLKLDHGSEWTSQSVASPSPEQVLTDDGCTMKDAESFDGDRSLSNSILFKVQFACWLLLEYAIKDGDIGRVLEQLKVAIHILFDSN
jgi:hypothetical protein